jgi:hypothetical protein
MALLSSRMSLLLQLVNVPPLFSGLAGKHVGSRQRMSPACVVQ